jgi:hypothetical protein
MLHVIVEDQSEADGYLDPASALAPIGLPESVQRAPILASG